MLAVTLRRLFLALDYLHSECKIVHTGEFTAPSLRSKRTNPRSYADIKADNIMFGLHDDSVFESFEQEELKDPSPRKVLDGRTIYISRDLKSPKEWGAAVLCDFGSAVYGDEEHTEDIQPETYRAPEVILQIPWSYEVDIWNAGCMVCACSRLRRQSLNY